MIVCQCNVISDQEIRAVIAGMLSADGPVPVTPGAVIRALGARRKCSGCVKTFVAVIEDCCRRCDGVGCPADWATQD